MLDIKFIRKNPKAIKENLKKRGMDTKLIDQLIELDEKRNHLVHQQIEPRRRERNDIAEEAKKHRTDELIERGQIVKAELKGYEDDLADVEIAYYKLFNELPNILEKDVPIGDESKNKVIYKKGKKPRFNFETKDHVELSERLGILDIPRATKVSGPRFAYLKGHAALLEFALIQFTLDKLIQKGFTPIIPPVLIKQEITEKLGYWHGGGNENYYLVSDFEKEKNSEEKANPLYLIGTSEHSIVPMHQDEIFLEEELPKRYVGISPCFRREAGSYGKDTRGIFRVHQFDKIEMVEFIKPSEDLKERRAMLSFAEELLTSLDLPYQVIKLASEDLSFPAAETIDIETWIPSQDKYRETHSISTTTTFQSRNFNIRYQLGKNSLKKSKDRNLSLPDGKQVFDYVHILNGTAFAIGRTLIAIFENYQQKDGSIIIPKVLQKYTNFTKIPA